MRVICIDDSDQHCNHVPHVVKGNIYNVIDTENRTEEKRGRYLHIGGVYYTLAECGDGVAYHESMFIKINEDQADETTFNRNYQTEKVTK